MRWLLLLLCGCRQLLGFEEAAGVDAGGDAPVTGTCAGAGLLPNTCFDEVRGPLTLLAELDTDRDCDSVSDGLCFVAAESISVLGTVGVIGSRPLVLWSASTIVVDTGATLDVRSTRDKVGPGANNEDCVSGDGSESQESPRIGTGGCGGGFASAGGNAGGAHFDLETLEVDCASGVTVLRSVRGGCRGGHGGASDVAGTANGGSSGGAVYLMAAEQIAIGGVIDARGAPGNKAIANQGLFAGGGGGGSGGLIAFDAPAVHLDGATIVALGAGGSSGSALKNGLVLQGFEGKDPALDPPSNANPTLATAMSNIGGGTGQSGGSVVSSEDGSGGGGGGGNGYIVVFSETTPTTIGAKIAPELMQ